MDQPEVHQAFVSAGHDQETMRKERDGPPFRHPRKCLTKSIALTGPRPRLPSKRSSNASLIRADFGLRCSRAAVFSRAASLSETLHVTVGTKPGYTKCGKWQYLKCGMRGTLYQKSRRYRAAVMTAARISCVTPPALPPLPLLPPPGSPPARCSAASRQASAGSGSPPSYSGPSRGFRSRASAPSGPWW